MNRMNATVGYARAVITPPFGTALAGYFPSRPAEGLHDDLYARVVAMRTDEPVIVVQLDLMCADELFVDMLEERICKMFLIPHENVFVSCIHTHSGSAATMEKDSLSELFRDELASEHVIGQVLWSIGQALSDMRPFTLSVSSSRLDGIGNNRSDYAAPYDNELILMQLTRDDGEKILLYNYACHPTVLSRENRLISADYPGAAAAILEQQDDIAGALFLNGADGDISTRFTRKESSFAEVRRIGGILGGEVLKMSCLAETGESVGKLRCISLSFQVAVKSMMTLEEADTALENAKRNKEEAEKLGLEAGKLRLVQSLYEGALLNRETIRTLHGVTSLSLQIRVLQINHLSLIYIPGELFSSLGLMLKEKVGGKAAVVCYGHGCVGYIPNRAAYERGCYEALSTPLAPGEGEKMVDFILSRLADNNAGL